MSEWIANARMYVVTPAVESAWRELLQQVAPAGVALEYPLPAPQPLERLWARAIWAGSCALPGGS